MARVETSAFTDLYQDKVDLIPGTKGSGKSALFRIFVDFLPQQLLKNKKVVIAHGVQKHGDSVFMAFHDEFTKLSEDDFVSFWCIYLTSLAHEQFIKGQLYQPYLRKANNEVQSFRLACEKAKIPEIKASMFTPDILGWTLNVLKNWLPRLHYKLPGDSGEIGLDLFGRPVESITALDKESTGKAEIPRFVQDIKESLEAVLRMSATLAYG